MGTAAIFNQALHDELTAYGAWFPVSNTFALGDYGLISDGVFVSMGNISEFGVTFAQAAGEPTSLDLSSAGTTVVRLADGAEVDVLPDEPIEAKVSIGFKDASSILVKAGDITVSQIQNLNEVARKLRDAPGWERKFRVVYGTYTGEECAVVTTRAAGAKFELSGQASALKMFDLGKVTAGVTVSHETEVGFKSVGKTASSRCGSSSSPSFGGGRSCSAKSRATTRPASSSTVRLSSRTTSSDDRLAADPRPAAPAWRDHRDPAQGRPLPRRPRQRARKGLPDDAGRGGLPGRARRPAIHA